MSAPFGLPVRSPPADRLVDDGERVEVAGFRLPGPRDPRPQPRLGRLHHRAVRSADRLRRRRPLRRFGRPHRFRRRLPPAPVRASARNSSSCPTRPGSIPVTAPRPRSGPSGGPIRSSATRRGPVRAVTTVWAISDLHLSFGRPERRDRYAARWRDHAERIETALARGRRAGGPRPAARRSLDGPEPPRGPARPRMARGTCPAQGPRARQPRPMVERRGAGPPTPPPPDDRRGRGCRRRRWRDRLRRARRAAADRRGGRSRSGSPPTASSPIARTGPRAGGPTRGDRDAPCMSSGISPLRRARQAGALGRAVRAGRRHGLRLRTPAHPGSVVPGRAGNGPAASAIIASPPTPIGFRPVRIDGPTPSKPAPAGPRSEPSALGKSGTHLGSRRLAPVPVRMRRQPLVRLSPIFRANVARKHWSTWLSVTLLGFSFYNRHGKGAIRVTVGGLNCGDRRRGELYIDPVRPSVAGRDVGQVGGTGDARWGPGTVGGNSGRTEIRLSQQPGDDHVGFEQEAG